MNKAETIINKLEALTPQVSRKASILFDKMSKPKFVPTASAQKAVLRSSTQRANSLSAASNRAALRSDDINYVLDKFNESDLYAQSAKLGKRTMNKAQEVFEKLSKLTVLPEIKPMDLFIQAHKILNKASREKTIRELVRKFPQLEQFGKIRPKVTDEYGKVQRHFGLGDLEKVLGAKNK